MKRLNLRNSKQMRSKVCAEESIFFPKLARRMSEMNSSIYLLGAGLGGAALATTSAVGMWFLESKKPSGKTVGRDFILGAILVVLLLQIVPESTTSLLTGLLAFIPMATPIMDVTVPSVEEVEVRVGVPRF